MALAIPKDKKLHFIVLFVVSLFVSIVWNLIALAVPALLLYVLHRHYKSFSMWLRIGITATVGMLANVLKELWDAGWMNWYPDWWPIPSWVPWLSNKNPLTGFDTVDLLFGTIGLFLGLAVYVAVVEIVKHEMEEAAEQGKAAKKAKTAKAPEKPKDTPKEEPKDEDVVEDVVDNNH